MALAYSAVRSIYLALILLPVAVSVSAGQSAKSAEPGSAAFASYFPVKAGTLWKYHTVTSNTTAGKVYEEVDIVRKVGRVEVKPDGSKTAEIGESGHGIAMAHVYSITESGVFLTAQNSDVNEITTDTPQPYLRGDLKPGAAWSWKGKTKSKVLATYDASFKATVIGVEDITVPGGSFHALHVKRAPKSEFIVGDWIIDEWFAPGVGLVMQKDVQGPFQTMLKLLAYESAATSGVSGASSTVDGTKLAVAELFPLTPGSQWMYSGSSQFFGDSFEMKVLRVQASADKVGNIAVILRTSFTDGKRSPVGTEDRLFVSDTEIRAAALAENDVSGFFDLRFSSPAIRVPLKEGATWEAQGTFKINGKGGKTASKFSVGAQEKVTTPAGSFQAWKIHEAITLSPDNKTEGDPAHANVDTWFAPKVGIIKRAAKSPLGDFEQVLKSYQIK
jgi:hypothetical protein